MLSPNYQSAVELLLRVVPLVFQTETFALKGGTAINLYLTAAPRLSVDLDLVFLPTDIPREQALSAITDELSALQARVITAGLRARSLGQVIGQDRQLLVSDGKAEIKIEVNQVFRGSALPPTSLDLHPKAQALFEVSAPARLLDSREIYAGKVVAALDRQHPRDLFDIWSRNQSSSFTSDDIDLVSVYIAGHNRPPHEILASRNKPLQLSYENSFVGMTADLPPAVQTLADTREDLRRTVRSLMSPQARQFLTTFFACEPEWGALPFTQLSGLPALQWKLQNLELFRSRRPQEFRRHNDQLAAILFHAE